MFCDQCGTPLQSGQKFCNRCGKEITGTTFGYPQRSRLHEHVRLLAILWFAFSALEAIGGVVLVVIANTIFLRMGEMGAPPETNFLHPLLTVLGFFVLLKSAAGFIAGYGLLQREPWARVLTLILGFLALIHIPFGTALGVYTLWVLLPAQSEEEYEHYQRRQAA
ncbi:MAG TPA: zinc ribbon domain-containing protein [Terriglobales bacterium]